MAAVAWTAIGLLASTLALLAAALFRLDSKIEAVGRDLGSRIDGLSGRIDAQGRDLGARIDALAQRVDAQTSRIDAHLERHAG